MNDHSFRFYLEILLKEHDVDIDVMVPTSDLADYIVNMLGALKLVSRRNQVKTAKEIAAADIELLRPRKRVNR